jgi:HEAT repeat protein
MNMKTQDVITTAEKLVSENNIIEAKALLIEYGYVKQNNAEIQMAFNELIPESPEFVNEKEGALKDLFSDSLPIRRKSSEYIFRQGRKEFTNSKAAWLGDPRTIELLISVLDNDTDKKVIENIAGALWSIGLGGRYLPDLRIYEKMFEILDSKNKEAAKYAAFALKNYVNDEKADRILESLTIENRITNVEALLANFYRTISENKQKEILPKLRLICDGKTNQTVNEKIKECILWLEEKLK